MYCKCLHYVMAVAIVCSARATLYALIFIDLAIVFGRLALRRELQKMNKKIAFLD